jgi:hypothetical protein
VKTTFSSSIVKEPSAFGNGGTFSGVVVQAMPLLVQVYGTVVAPEAVVATKGSQPWAVNDRVWILFDRGKSIVLGFVGNTGNG